MGKKSKKRKSGAQKSPAGPLQRGIGSVFGEVSVPASDRTVRHGPALQLLLIALLGLLAYSNTFGVPLQWDDEKYVFKNPAVRDLDSFFGKPRDGLAEKVVRDLRTRYVAYLTFALNYRFGGREVLGWHIVNLAIHIANALLVYALVLLLCRTQRLARSALARHPESTAFFTAALFVAHPVQIEAVTYIYQRLASLVTLFYLLSVVSYLGWCQASSRPSKYAFYAVSLLAAVLAMKTKENAFTLPVMLMMVEVLFHDGPFRRRLLPLLPFLATMLIIPLTLLGLEWSSKAGATALASVTDRSSGFSRWDYLVTQFGVIVLYLRLLLLPVNQNLDYLPPLIRSVLDPHAFFPMLVLLGVAATGVVFAVKSRRGLPWLLLPAFGIFWFFIALSVESSVLPIVMLLDEYRVYLPSAGFFLAVVSLLIFVRERFADSRLRIAVTAVLLIAPLLLAVATFRRNIVWQSPITLWSDVSLKAPHNYRALNNLGNALLAKKRLDEAEKAYRAAIRINPDYPDARNNLGYVCNITDRPDEAIEHLEIAIRKDDERVKALNNLGNAYVKKGMPDMAIVQYRKALAIAPDFPDLHSNLGAVLMDKGLREEAIRHYRTALELDPDYADAHGNLANALLLGGEDEEAAEHYRETLKLDPRHADALSNFAVYYMKRREFDRAEELLSEAVRIQPKHEMAHYNLGRIHLFSKEFDNARREFETVLSINPRNEQARRYLTALDRRQLRIDPSVR